MMEYLTSARRGCRTLIMVRVGPCDKLYENESDQISVLYYVSDILLTSNINSLWQMNFTIFFILNRLVIFLDRSLLVPYISNYRMKTDLVKLGIWWRNEIKCMSYGINIQHGDVAHMVERSLSMREVLGSMPNFSTFFFTNTNKINSFYSRI